MRMVNFHDNGTLTARGVRHVAVYVVPDFPSTTYGTNVDAASQCIFNGVIAQNPGAANNGANYEMLTLLSMQPTGRYVVLDLLDCWDGATAPWMGIRPVELQTKQA